MKVRTFAKAYINFQQKYNNTAQNNPTKFLNIKKGKEREILNDPLTTPPPSFCFVASDDQI